LLADPGGDRRPDAHLLGRPDRRGRRRGDRAPAAQPCGRAHRARGPGDACARRRRPRQRQRGRGRGGRGGGPAAGRGEHGRRCDHPCRGSGVRDRRGHPPARSPGGWRRSMSAEKDDGAEKSEETTELLGTGTWIRQGPATLVLRENAWVVLVPGLRKQVTEAAWTVLRDRPAPGDVLGRLGGAGRRGRADTLTAILFGFHDGADAVFGVKGTTPIAVYTADGSQQLAGTEEEPFVLTTLHGVRRVAFGDLPAEESIGAPRLSAGIVPVRGFVHVTMDPAALADADRAALAEQIEADGRSIEDPEAKKRRAARPAPA